MHKGGGANDCLMFEEFRSIANSLPAANPLILLMTIRTVLRAARLTSV
jgi:hypothetical protein